MYRPSILVERCTAGTPWESPEVPTLWPRETHWPAECARLSRKDRETLKPGTGSMVMVRIPATVPAKVTRPEAGARTVEPSAAP
jgi:hypothetical protein